VTASLPLELLLALLLTLAAVCIHILGSAGILVLIRVNAHRIRPKRHWLEQLLTVLLLVLGLLILHALEIGVFAAAYLAVGAAADLSSALYVSTSSYATVGLGDLSAGEWRLLAAWEGLVGFILIGWSTALFITTILRIWTKDHSWFDPTSD
jgi:hypothetical protein